MWWKEAVIYEVYVDKFAKNFKGMGDKVPYFKNLGINTIWLLPHYPSPMVDGGYDVSDYFGVRENLGNLDDFRDFILKSHEAGIRVIVDLVLNHVSISHPWFIEASKSINNPKRDYFLWSKTGKDLQEARNPFSHFIPSNWNYSTATDEYYFSTFYSEQADLNWDNPEVFNEVIKIIDFWAGMGVDGFRLDAISHLIKREGTNCYHLPEIHGILKNMRRHMDEKHPGVILLAEACGTFDEIISYFGNGDECHMAFNFPLMSSLYLAIKRDDMSIVRDMVRESSRIPDTCQWATFVTNHDEVTFKPLNEQEREEVISWLDPGKRYSFPGGSGVAMRLATTFNNDREKIINFIKLLFSLPGSPVIYYGSEIGMKNLDLPEPPKDARIYVRGDFDWEEAEKQMREEESMLNIIKSIILTKKTAQSEIIMPEEQPSAGAGTVT